MVTKYPVVLVHGMMAKDFPFWRAFRGISGFLRKQGVTVYVTNQDGVGSIETNAQQLKAEILEILQRENCEKVNLIAHSKGGLDSRYMISCLDMAEHVASLTTLSTPHHGSGLSAHLLKMPSFLAKVIAFFNDTLFRLLGDKHPDILQLGRELTKAFLRFSPYQISRYCEQDDTDGMVSVHSSQWGNYRGGMGESIDHFKMVGMYGTKKKLTGVGLFYLHIIQELKAMGF